MAYFVKICTAWLQCKLIYDKCETIGAIRGWEAIGSSILLDPGGRQVIAINKPNHCVDH